MPFPTAMPFPTFPTAISARKRCKDAISCCWNSTVCTSESEEDARSGVGKFDASWDSNPAKWMQMPSFCLTANVDTVRASDSAGASSPSLTHRPQFYRCCTMLNAQYIPTSALKCETVLYVVLVCGGHHAAWSLQAC